MTPCHVDAATRRAVLEHAGYACQTCGVRTALHTHRDARGDYRALCRECHHAAHRDPAGMWWRDVADMAAEWEPYWLQLERD